MSDSNDERDRARHPGPPDGWPICEIATCNAPIVDEQDEGLSIEMGDFEFMSEHIKGPMVNLCRVHHEALLRAVKAFFAGDGLLNRAKVKAVLLRMGASEHALHSDGYWMGVRACCKALKLPMPSKPKGDE